MTRRTTLATAAALALTALPACDRDDDVDTRAIEKTLNAWHAAVAAGDDERACRHLTARAQAQFSDSAPLGDLGGCEGAVTRVAAMLTPDQKAALGKLRIRRARVDGDRAEVRAGDLDFPGALEPLRDPASDRTVFRRVDGRWLLEDLG